MTSSAQTPEPTDEQRAVLFGVVNSDEFVDAMQAYNCGDATDAIALVVAGMVADAVSAERERCASIAEEYAGLPAGGSYEQGQIFAAAHLAHRIRRINSWERQQ